MTLYELLPVRRKRKNYALRNVNNPFGSLQRRWDQFDELFRDWAIGPFSGLAEKDENFIPGVNMSENEKEIHISAELPGIDEKDIELSLENGVLTIKGEKKQEQENKDENYYSYERTFGTFERSLTMPCEIDENNINAKFKKGVLTVRLPKKEPEKVKSKRIMINDN